MNRPTRIQATPHLRTLSLADCAHIVRHRGAWIVALLLLTPGKSAPEQTAAATAQRPAHELRIGIPSTDYPPFVTRTGGFSRALGEKLAEDLGFHGVIWVPFRWPELAAQVEAQTFDLAVGGISWRADREVRAPMSRALASFGPCLVGDLTGQRLAVNRGGFLEGWARQHYPERELLTVEDNATLPEVLTTGRASAFLTDSFEVKHFARASDHVRCEPATERKVVWVANTTMLDDVDSWIEESEPWLRLLRERYLDAPLPRGPIDHLLDLIARRLALMPAVAAWKKAHDTPIEDLARERVVIDATREHAALRGLDPDSTESLFRLLVELAKGIQRTRPDAEETLDLQSQLRPALLQLGDRIVDALAKATPLEEGALEQSAHWAPLEPWTTAEQRQALRRALLAVRAQGVRAAAAR